MKYIIFNIVVAGALVYLVAGDDLKLPGSADEAVRNAETNLDSTLDQIRPQVEETASKVAEQVAAKVAARIADEITEKLARLPETESDVPAPIEATLTATPPEMDSTTAAMLDKDERLYQDPAEENGPATVSSMEAPLPPVEDIYIEPEVTHKPIEGLEESIGHSTELAQNSSRSDVIQIAEGEELMSPRDRQRELDALAQNMEMLFLSRAGE